MSNTSMKYHSKKTVIMALKASIEHWNKDIVLPLQDGRIILRDADTELIEGWDTGKIVKCFDDYCPLCKLFRRFLACSLVCPLKSCVNPNDAWYKFYKNPCLKTALDMVKKLESVLSKVEKDKKQRYYLYKV